jgi:predicted DNA-binding transcriptional regulator AlpA
MMPLEHSDTALAASTSSDAALSTLGAAQNEVGRGEGGPRKRNAGAQGNLSTLTREVLFIEDVAQILRTSRSTVERRRRSGTFPIPELPSVDERPRWSRRAVEEYLASTGAGLRHRRGRSARRTY